MANKVEAALRSLMNEMVGLVPPGLGITLLVFDYGADGTMAYGSTAPRKDMVRALMEFWARPENAALIDELDVEIDALVKEKGPQS